MASKLSLFAAFCMGAAAGTAIGMMFAPASGEELRGQLGDRMNDYFGTASEAYDDAKVRLTDAVNQGMDQAKGMARQTSRRARRAATQVAEAASERLPQSLKDQLQH